MNFSKIIKDSFRITIKHRFLWLLALIAGGSSFGSNLMNSSDTSSFNTEKAREMFNLPAASDSAHNYIASKAHALSIIADPPPPANSEIVLIVLLAILSLIMILALIYIAITAKGALILSVADLAGEKESNFSSAWGQGHKYFWRRLSFGLLLFLFVIISIFILALPAIIFGVAGLTIPAIIFGVLAFLIFATGMIYLCLIIPVAERALFLNQHRPLEAMKAGHKIFKANWANFLILFLIIFGFGIAFALAMVFVAVIPGLVILLIGYLLYLITPVLGYIVGGMLALVLIVALVIICGAFEAFTSSILTLGYIEAKK